MSHISEPILEQMAGGRWTVWSGWTKLMVLGEGNTADEALRDARVGASFNPEVLAAVQKLISGRKGGI